MLVALVIALPLLLVRFVYALLVEFTYIGVFSLFTNWNAVAWLCMGVGMEFALVVLFTVTGLLPPRAPGWKPMEQVMSWRGESLDGRQSPG